MVVTAGAEEPQVIGAFMLLPESGLMMSGSYGSRAG
jgi:hypothetical protein